MRQEERLTATHWVLLTGALWSLLYTTLYHAGTRPSRLPPGFTDDATYYAYAAFGFADDHLNVTIRRLLHSHARRL